jgi:hypothetical protein
VLGNIQTYGTWPAHCLGWLMARFLVSCSRALPPSCCECGEGAGGVSNARSAMQCLSVIRSACVAVLYQSVCMLSQNFSWDVHVP